MPQLLEQLRALGGECVELNGRPGQHDGLVIDAGAFASVRTWADDAGIAIRSVGGYCDFAQTDDGALAIELRRLREACELASALEVGIVRAFVGEPKVGLGRADARLRAVDAFGRAAIFAEELGVTLAIENHGNLMNDGRALAALVEEVDSPHVKLTLDSGNFSWAGHDLAQTRADYEAVVPHTVCVHIKDGVWGPERFEFVPAGEGSLPVERLIDDLRRRSYDGPIYSEYEGAGDFLEGTRASIGFLRSILER
ncbi:MAG TPA: sugar phosphate isomerase/epimerase family protein [Gaiellaceae bacterium]|nr:sugar phosphate isomerase/epimerase family protein [Gaiellaceae bacterium]